MTKTGKIHSLLFNKSQWALKDAKASATRIAKKSHGKILEVITTDRFYHIKIKRRSKGSTIKSGSLGKPGSGIVARYEIITKKKNPQKQDESSCNPCKPSLWMRAYHIASVAVLVYTVYNFAKPKIGSVV